jgi:crotonobetainyl-CoA:carnitine CoA-transferase CaiB-like acyl-CoA transferase
MLYFFDTIADTTRRFERDRVLERLRAAGVPVAPVNRPEDVAGDPQITGTGAVEEHDHPAAGRMLRPRSPVHRMGETIDLGPAPAHGEHTGEILRELDIDAVEFTQLRESGVVR